VLTQPEMSLSSCTIGESISLVGVRTNTSILGREVSLVCTFTRDGKIVNGKHRNIFDLRLILEARLTFCNLFQPKRLAGWWGHSKETRFDMPSEYSPLPGAAGWQFSNPSVLDVVSLLASLQVFEQTNALDNSTSTRQHLLSNLRAKSIKLTGYLESLLQSSPFYRSPEDFPPSDPNQLAFTIITPSSPSRRGCQLSLLFGPESSMQPIFDRLRNRGILGDERKPGVIRFGPTPLYNTFEDVRETAQCLEEVMQEISRERD
jgi:kynureninase